jgi:hypothetical protein
MSPRDNEVKAVDAPAASLPPVVSSVTSSQQELPVDKTAKGGKWLDPKTPNLAQIVAFGPPAPKSAGPRTPNKNNQKDQKDQKDDAAPAARDSKEDERPRSNERKNNPTPTKQKGSGRGPRGNRPNDRKAKDEQPMAGGSINAGMAKATVAKSEALEPNEPKTE